MNRTRSGVFAVGVAMMVVGTGFEVARHSTWDEPAAQTAVSPLSAAVAAPAWQLFEYFVAQAQAGLPGWTSRCTLLQCGVTVALDHSELARTLPAAAAVRGGKAVEGKKAAVQPDLAEPDFVTFFDHTVAPFINTICNVHPTIPSTVPCTNEISVPGGSTIARTVWGVIPKSGHGTLGLYNSSKFPIKVTDVPGNDAARYIRPAVPIDMTTSSCPEGAGTRASVPIGCFYHVMLTAANLAKYLPDHNSADLSVGETIVLLAVHLIRKDTAGSWTFATFWWQQNTDAVNNSCAASSGLCTSPDSAWRYYAMDTVEPGGSGNATIRPVFNPYIEASLSNNVNTNCAVCHSFAGVSGAGPSISALQSKTYGAAGPVSQQQNQQDANGFLKSPGTMGTDHLWSIAIALQ